MAVRKSTKKPPVLQLKITLQDLKPPIWRRIQLTNSTTLEQLHGIIQAVMGWQDGHLHAFDIAGTFYGAPDPEGLNDFESENIELRQLVTGSMLKFFYIYDFGDDWQHEILVEKVVPHDAGLSYPLCLKGKRACPPEDCGGVGGYMNLLEILDNPQHSEYEERLAWAGPIEPDAFDVQAANQSLQQLQ